MLKLPLLSLLLSASLLSEEIPQNIIDTGEKVSKELLKQLGPKLKHEMKTNGPVAAAKFCHENAYILTEEVNLHQLEGVSVKRISLQERNPANEPSATEKKVLEQMHSLHKEKKLPAYLIEKEEKNYKYYKPLVINKPVCLKCHGDLSKDPELSAFMKEHYPLDKAVNYKMNDLRGAIVVEIKQ